MKKTTKIVLIIIAAVSFAWACRKIEIGFLSDYIKYEYPVMFVNGGTDFVTTSLRDDGSTLPLKAEMLEIRNKETGAVANDLLTSHSLMVWKKTYNYKTDTTEALLMEKLELKEVPAFELNSVSGQLRFNANSTYAEGTKYEFDLRISNIKGTKDYPGIGQIEITPVVPVIFSGFSHSITYRSTNKAIYSLVENVDKLNKGTSAVNKVTKISDESAPGITVILKVVDKNGVPFSPSKGEVIKGYPGIVLPSYDDVSVNTKYNDDAIVYHFPVLPFPYYNWYSPNLEYYNVPETAVGIIDSPLYVPGGKYWLKFRLNLLIYEPGTWEIRVIYPNLIHK